MPFMANITYNQKLSIFRLLKALPARYVLLDLSAGTAFNTLDLFHIGNSGIVVTTPEHPALMSTLVFVKNLVLRAIDQNLRRDTSLKDRLNEMYKQSVKDDQVFTVEGFRTELAKTNPEAAEKIEGICRRIRPRFVYNMAESFSDTDIFANIDRTLREVLSIQCDHFGVIPYDPQVRRFLKEPGIFLLDMPASPTVDTIDRVGHRIKQFWDIPLEGSAGLLTEYARKVLPDTNEVAPIKARAKA
jgi:flagellar biosynthesis protein FlhG